MDLAHHLCSAASQRETWEGSASLSRFKVLLSRRGLRTAVLRRPL